MRRLGAVAAFVLAGVLVVVGFRQSARVSTGHDVFVNAPGIIDASSSPTIVVSPRAPKSVVVVYRRDRPALGAQLAWSSDGGATFRPTALPLPDGLDRPFFPDVAFAPDGVLYVSYVNLAGRGNTPANLWVARSTDGGRTLGAPSLVATGLPFQPRIAIGPDGVVRATWLDVVRNNPNAALATSAERVVISGSADGAQTWSAPIPVSAQTDDLVGAATPTVIGDRVYVAYQDFGPRPASLANGGTAPPGQPYDLMVTSSAAGGQGFSAPVTVAHAMSSQRFSFFFSQFASIAGGPDRSASVTWAESRRDNQDVFIRRSRDGGVTWSPPVQVDPVRSGGAVSASLPQVAVDEQGRIDIAYLYRPGSAPTIFTDAYLAMSADGGRSFRSTRLSSESFNATVAPNLAGGTTSDQGSRLGLVASKGSVHVAWPDTRLGTATTGREDVVTAVVARPGHVPAVRLWLFVVAAALALGSVVLVVSTRTSPGDRPERTSSPASGVTELHAQG